MAEKLKILIVEDDPVSLIVSVKSLEKRNVEVLSAADAYKALDLYSKNGDLTAVITDIQLPGMDGIEMMRKMRRVEESKGTPVPIFAITAYALGVGEENRRHFIDFGFDDVFVKPIDYDEILETIQLYL